MSSLSDQFIEAIAQRVVAVMAQQAPQPVVRPRLLTVEQAAVYLGRTEHAIRGMQTRGVLPVVRGDGRVMFDIEDLQQLIEASKR